MTSNRIDEDLAVWCGEVFASVPVETIFETQHLSRVVGYRLADGHEIVLKLRPPSERVLACLDVQLYLWQAGFPCAQPLAGPSLHDGRLLTAEAYVPPGDILTGPDAPRPFAKALHQLLVITSPVQPRLSLDPTPPWLGWQHPGPGLWPPPDDLPDDLNLTAFPEIDDVAHRVAALLKASSLTKMIGHADWTATNLEWRDGNLHIVHDWDSLAYLPEAAFAGGAAVIFTTPFSGASLDESSAFLAAYEAARSSQFSPEERAVAWAAGLWNLAFDARKDAMRGGGPSLERLRLEAGERLTLAGA